ncbi:MAG: hypothetical protein QOF94_2907 [Acidobacteriaceae bacterium]
MKCPTCQAELSQTGKFWVCPEHGVVQTEAQTSIPTANRPQDVFISYGRQDAVDFAKRLAADLQQRGGHRIFIDLDGIEKGGVWEVRIEQGIRHASVLAAVMTPHSLRETSVCRDEIVFALNEGKHVVPIKADPNPNLKPSLLLARRNWIDFSANYDDGLETLLQYLKGDESVLHLPALPTITGVVPLDFGPEIARFTAGFTGREWVNREIDNWLKTDSQRAMVIVAEPGVGKSAIAAWLTQARDDVIAIHFCTQQNSRTRDPYEFVASLVGQLHARLPGFAGAVEVKHPEVRRPTAADAFRELIVEVARSLPALDRPRLIVIDSLDEGMEQVGETVLEVLVQQASDLPESLRILATTRPEEHILHRIRTLSVFELMAERPENRADVRTYIERRLGSPLLQPKLIGQDVKTVANQLDALSDGNYLYARMALDALHDGSISADDLHHLSPGLTRFFYETFRKRFPDLEVFEHTLAPLLRALAAARGPLPFNILQGLSTEAAEVTRRRLHDLRSYLRIYGQSESATYSVYHRSLKDWLTDPDAAGGYWCRVESGDRSLAELGWRVYREGHLSDSEYCSRYLPEHLIGAEEWSKLEQLLTDLALFEQRWNQDRKYEWMRYWQKLKGRFEPGPCYENVLNQLPEGTAPVRLAHLSDLIGWFLRDMGLLSTAQPFTERALRLQEEILGEDHPDIAITVHSLAELCRAQQDFAAALPLYQRAQRIREENFGAESPEVATSLHDLAEFHHDQKHYDEALQYYRRALTIRQAVLKPDDPAIADCLNDMAALQYEIGNLDEALPNYQTALRIYEHAHGPDHPDVAAALHNVARIYRSQNDLEGAISLCSRALDILDRTFGPNHPKTQTCTTTLIEFYQAAGKAAEMIPLVKRVLAAKQHTLGSDHPEVEALMLALAEFNHGIGDTAAAAECLRQVMDLKERTLTTNSVEWAATLEALAWRFVGESDYVDAVACARKALVIREKIAGQDATETAAALNALARCLQEKGDYASALPFCRRALEIREQKLQPSDPDIAVSLNNLGLTLVCLGQFFEAEQHLLSAASIDPSTPNPHYWLARLNQKRSAPGDSKREAAAWQQYLELGAPLETRKQEALARLAELEN